MATKAQTPKEGKRSRQIKPRPAAEEVQPRKHYKIDIYRDWCKSCGLCAAFCPRECLSLDEEGNPVVTRSDRCTGCGWCELHCPDFAISVRECDRERPKEEAD